ncbi:hypothetical protein E4U39_002714 [Claviceps sp. Clav50 group G5]|nr:hypothetical protein E4U39_002714 [Claviceps sp. Clav50 group G5]
MASEYQMSLPYPNHSLSQMTSSQAPKTSQAQAHPDASASMEDNQRVSGARQKVLVVSLLIGLLFSSLDTAIVATSLITISHEMNDFVHAPWIVLAYLLTYMGIYDFLFDILSKRIPLTYLGFAVCISKLSDIYGLKNMLILSWIIFISFSMGCASSKGMISLYVKHGLSRASGLYSLTQIGLVEIGPADRRSLMGALVGVTLAIAFVLGPIIGGVISELSDWRWLFNMNVPCGLVTILVITSFWPQERVADLLSWILGVRYATSWVTTDLEKFFLTNDSVTLFTGFPYICFSIILPERFQMVNSQNSLMAGVRILPMLVACACGSFLGAALSSKRNNTSYTLVAASCLQLLGTGLMTTVSGDSERAIAQYGFQAIFGLGVGLSFSAATIMTNVMATEPHERAPAQGAVAQARVLGGCVGLSLCTILFNLHATQNLRGHLTDAELGMIHRSPLLGLQLPTKLRELVRTVYIEAFGLEIKVIAISCAIMVVISLFTLEKQPPSIERLTAPLKDESSSYRRGSDSGTEINDLAPQQQQHVG